jgi:hypothetical protein
VTRTWRAWRLIWSAADELRRRREPPVISRQKIVGWILIVVSVAYIAYFLRVRLFTPGPILEKKEWVQLISSIVILMLGTINVRMAAMRERRRKGSPD